MTSPRPEFIYKITEDEPPSPIPEVYPPSELDQKDGFVHLSTATQIPKTASLFFTQTKKIYLLKLRVSALDPSKIKWDEVPGTNGGCPHLYGVFGRDQVVSVIGVKRGEGEGWEGVLLRECEGWLV
ncbi:hypothetical protein QBC47DRAFT_219101 [Echria macrotheca]|uniref:DUF952 domain-containing protein n=1 Tax=Echria macrotheca TaxID=438768 RepID=A0AAJ0F8L8_9PEZI|nr:hypothetical protein QBC47DRAFT_219101 [Echria macrotheca]